MPSGRVALGVPSASTRRSLANGGPGLATTRYGEGCVMTETILGRSATWHLTVSSNLGPPSRAHARARSKNYAYQNWKAHLSGALRPDCGLARLWEPQIQEYARTRARVF